MKDDATKGSNLYIHDHDILSSLFDMIHKTGVTITTLLKYFKLNEFNEQNYFCNTNSFWQHLLFCLKKLMIFKV